VANGYVPERDLELERVVSSWPLNNFTPLAANVLFLGRGSLQVIQAMSQNIFRELHKSNLVLELLDFLPLHVKLIAQVLDFVFLAVESLPDQVGIDWSCQAPANQEDGQNMLSNCFAHHGPFPVVIT
jgi:hypothetical protein